MKIFLTTTCVAMALASSAMATGTDTPTPTPPPTSPPTSGAALGESAVSQAQQQQQQQSQDQSTANANNAQQSVDARQYTRRNVATAYAPSVINMAPCAMGAGVGVQGSSFGVSFGGSKTNLACERRANAMVLMELGEREAAVLYLAGSDRAINDALTRARRPQPAPASPIMAPMMLPIPDATSPTHSSTDGERG